MTYSQTGPANLAHPGNDQSEAARLLPVIYAELRDLAAHYLRGERPHHTWGPTDLVHEAYLRLAHGAAAPLETPRQLLALTARAMRHLLVDHARARAAAKRGDGDSQLPFDEALNLGLDRDQELVALDEALDHLEGEAPHLAQVVELRFFAGFSIEETAAILETSPKTVQRRWNLARSWLYREIVRT